MHRKPSKKQLLAQRMITFTATVLSVAVIVTGTLFLLLGYRLDGADGQLEQGALVQFNSRPSGAQVTIDGVETGSQTATKRSLLAGEHSFMMSKDGYRPWTRTLKLEAGTLTWLDYIRLVPMELAKQTLQSFKNVADVEAAPDNQTIVIQQDASSPTFDVIDIRAQDVSSTVVQLPSDLLTDVSRHEVTHRYTMDSWDPDGRYLLVQHQYGDEREWLVFDTENVTASRNITRLLRINLSDVQFASTNGNVLYGLSDGVIRKLDLQNATLSRSLVDNVVSFTMYGTSVLTYVGKNDQNQQVVGLYRDGDELPHILRTVSDPKVRLQVDTARYYSNDYVALSQGNEVTILAGRYPSSAQTDASSLTELTSFTADTDVDQLTFSPDGAYVLARSGLTFSTYELEYDWLHHERIDTTEEPIQHLQWLDDAHLVTSYDGHLTMRDFDGTNVNVIMPIVAGTDATLSQNGRYIYAVNKTDDSFRLERVTMVLD